MLKKLFPLLLCALLILPGATCFAEPLGDGKDVLDLSSLSPDTLGLKMTSEIVNNTDPAIKFQTEWPVTINLATRDLRNKHVDRTVLTFSADMKGQGLEGTAYLEMYMHVPGGSGGAFFARGIDRPLTPAEPGWSRFKATYTLAEGQVPDQVTLNLVITGKGTVWMKNIRLQRLP